MCFFGSKGLHLDIFGSLPRPLLGSIWPPQMSGSRSLEKSNLREVRWKVLFLPMLHFWECQTFWVYNVYSYEIYGSWCGTSPALDSLDTEAMKSNSSGSPEAPMAEPDQVPRQETLSHFSFQQFPRASWVLAVFSAPVFARRNSERRRSWSAPRQS